MAEPRGPRKICKKLDSWPSGLGKVRSSALAPIRPRDSPRRMILGKPPLDPHRPSALPERPGDRRWGRLATLAPLLVLAGACQLERTGEPGKGETEKPALTPARPEATFPSHPSLSETLGGERLSDNPSASEAPTSGASAEQTQKKPPTSPDREAPALSPARSQRSTPPLSDLAAWLADVQLAAPARAFIYAGGEPTARFTLPETPPRDSLEAVVEVAAKLEESPWTNAGLGSALRLDGSAEAEALVQSTDGRRGLVLGVERVKTPSRVAAALVAAGGAELRGRGIDVLAGRLGFELSPLTTDESRSAYLSDLAGLLRQSERPANLGLFHLFVPPEEVARALSLPDRRSQNLSAGSRWPVLAVVASEEGGLAFAASHGGRPLALPGAPSLLEGERFMSGRGKRFVALLTEEDCPVSAADLAASTLSPRGLVQKLLLGCPTAHYAIVEPGSLETNLPEETFVAASFGQPPLQQPFLPHPTPAPRAASPGPSPPRSTSLPAAPTSPPAPAPPLPSPSATSAVPSPAPSPAPIPAPRSAPSPAPSAPGQLRSPVSP